MILARRRFFGLMAAPAVIGISGRMSLWMPLPLTITPQKLIVPPSLEEFTTDTLRYKATERWIVTHDFHWRAVYGTPAS